jgi:hypothetical protein
MTGTKCVTLTSSDPEPLALGAVVTDALGIDWVHVPSGYGGAYWLPVDDAGTPDPESWVKIAGNYGPVVLHRPGCAHRAPQARSIPDGREETDV